MSLFSHTTLTTRISTAAKLALIAGGTLLSVPAMAQSYGFTTIDNPGDPVFNQLLGINNAQTIVGYFGDGAKKPNKGFSFTGSTFTDENFPGSTQTQVVAINDHKGQLGTAGFWVDADGNNFGFIGNGKRLTSVANPAAQPFGGVVVNQLLGRNNRNQAVGFYVDGTGNAHGYLYSLVSKSFTEITMPQSFNATSILATGINDRGWVSGLYTDAAGNTHGFIDEAGAIVSFDDPAGNGSSTQFFGINKNNLVVGAFTDAKGKTHGLVLDPKRGTWTQIDDPNQSQHPAFGVAGTLVNGINDKGELVGFYSDGHKVHGFMAVPQTVL